jgi:hypothetical protein
MRREPIRRSRFTERGHKSVRLQAPLRGVQTEMSGYDAQDPVAEEQIGVDRTTGLMAGNGKIDRIRREHRKPGQDRIAEAPATVTGTGGRDYPAACNLAEKGPLIGLQADATANAYLLQTCDVSVYLAQNRPDSAGIITPIDANTGVNVIRDDSDRVGRLAEAI